jgi:hypothetical protein
MLWRNKDHCYVLKDTLCGGVALQWTKFQKTRNLQVQNYRNPPNAKQERPLSWMVLKLRLQESFSCWATREKMTECSQARRVLPCRALVARCAIRRFSFHSNIHTIICETSQNDTFQRHVL